MPLFSCFRTSKKNGDYDDESEKNIKRGKSLPKGATEIVYVAASPENQIRFGSNVRTIYRTENVSSNSQYGQDTNRQTKSYPVSPEKRSLYKVYSFEQRPSFEKQKLIGRRDSRDSRDSRNVTVYAANVDEGFAYNAPRRSNFSQGVGYEKEEVGSKSSPRYLAEKPNEDYEKAGLSKDKSDLPLLSKEIDGNNEAERLSEMKRSKLENEHFSPRSSKMENRQIVYLATDDTGAPPKIKTVVRARPQSSKNFSLGSSVKPMVYRAEDIERSPILTRIRPSKPPILATPDGKILRPLVPENARRMSMTSTKSGQPVRLPVLQSSDIVDGFPLASGGEMLVAAPMIGGGGVKRGGSGKKVKPKPILRKGGRGPPPRGPPMDDYDYDDYGDYDDVSEMYYDDGYGGGGGGYYDEGHGYPDDGYGRGPPMGRGGRQPRQAVYVSQMPDNKLPTSAADKGKNPPFRKTGKAIDAHDSCIDRRYYDLKAESEKNQEQLQRENKIKLISSAQQTDIANENELDFICFSPDRCYKASEAPDDPNSKLRWRIIIKRGDEQ